MTKAIKYYWEDFPVGSVRETGSVTLSQDEIVVLESKRNAGLVRSK